MRYEDEELDYLVGTQLEIDPASFEQVVKEAFLLEHDCVQNMDIAEQIGKDKSRISQMFSEPSKLKAETVASLIEHLKSPTHRARIVQAWTGECFGKDARSKVSKQIGDQVSAKTLRRIDRQVREGRLTTAIRLSFEAVRKSDDWDLRQQFLDRAYFASQRLDEPARAMFAARCMAIEAEKRKDSLRLATAYFFRARVLLGMADSLPRDVAEASHVTRELFAQSRVNSSTSVPYVLIDQNTLDTFELASTITFMEREQIPVNEEVLEGSISEVLANLKSKMSYQKRFRAHILIGRMYTLLGQTFQAQEHIELAMKSGDVKNLNSFEMCGLLQGRVMRQTDSGQTTASYLRKVVLNCARTSDRYHGRLAEYEWARVEAEMFPPARPVC